MSSYNTFRNTGIVGEYEIDNILEQSSIHFSEWHNGEGLDFVLFDKQSNETGRFSLTNEQLNAIAVIGEAIGFIEMKEVQSEAEKFKKQSEQRQKDIERIRAKFKNQSSFQSKHRDDIDLFDSDVPF